MFSTLLLSALVTLPVAAASDGSVHGVIVDSNSHRPIQHATIQLNGQSYDAQTQTDGHGRFALLGIVPDLYAMSIDARGHEGVVLRICVQPGEAQSLKLTLGQNDGVSYASKDQEVLHSASLRRTQDLYSIGGCRYSPSY